MSRYASIPKWVRDISPAILDCKIYARGRSLDLKLSGSTIHIIRILHGKRDVKSILDDEGAV
ncbi:MAG TPA: hypothetical protein VOA78_05335 [Candidatus Dormibacteraeota bacterium]|nr:hypothetical protein [Candidatus Dormibacteraeota bacterium]